MTSTPSAYVAITSVAVGWVVVLLCTFVSWQVSGEKNVVTGHPGQSQLAPPLPDAS